jgi:OOP family OmpA-OmpF porin
MIKEVIYVCFLSLVLMFGLPTSAQAQKNIIGANALMIDYQGPYDRGFDNFRRYTSGAEIYYRRQLSSAFSLQVPFRLGVGQRPEASDNFTLTGLDLRANYRFEKPGRLVYPYFFAGIGGVKDTPGNIRVEIPAGGGLEIPIAPQIGLQVYLSYRFGLGEGNNSFQHGVGFVYLMGQNKKPEMPKISDIDGDGVPDSEDECPTIAGLPEHKGCPDTDGDGIPDHLDECPTFAGLPQFGGCPDTDGDGIPDHLDECPTVFGLKENRGCPVGDKDGDGVPDDVDKCPDVFGLAAFDGCPDSDGDGIPDHLDDCPNQFGPRHLKGCPDSDGDGVPDYLDKCPLIPGPATNFGCPELKKEEKDVLTKAMQAVQFDLNSSVLRPESFAILDQVVTIMRKYDYYDLSIEGHTDSTGDPSFNQLLSENRANTCKEYIIGKGIDRKRVSSKGFGKDKPLYDNSTPEGRKLNRRVEFNMKVR